MSRVSGVWSIFWFSLSLIILPNFASAQRLIPNYYSAVCPNLEKTVRDVVKTKINQTFVTIPATLRLFFHDCLVEGCDASVMIASTENNKAEKDHPDNLSLAGDGFDTVVKAKAAVDEDPSCKNKVSCADILALATRDVIELSGGPSYEVELGRLDGLTSTASSVNGRIPNPNFNLNQLIRFFFLNGLNTLDMIALSAGHTVGFSHCDQVATRIYNYSRRSEIDPTINKTYATDLRAMCPIDVDPRIAINMDPITPRKFDNNYFKNLQQGKGLFTSDQVLYNDFRSRPFVNIWARNTAAFNRAFVIAITKMGRIRVKTVLGRNGNIRRDCSVFN